MTLRLKINLIVGALTILFVAAVLALQLRSMRESVNEEVVAANRVATQLLQRNAWLYAAQGTPAMLAYLRASAACARTTSSCSTSRARSCTARRPRPTRPGAMRRSGSNG